MTCTACARRIEKNLNKLEGVSAYVDFATETAHVSVPQGVTEDDLRRVVEDAGYSISSGKSSSESMVWRLQVGALLSVPVVVISMIPQLMPMNWGVIAAVLTAPVALWVAWPFHSAMFKNLRHRATTMDTLVSIGVLVSYFFSLVEIAAGGMGTYFEVAAVVPTVVLFGRWLEVRTRRSATDAVRALLAAVPNTATVRRDGIQVEIPTSQVVVGDVIVVAAGQTIPVDGRVVEAAPGSSLDNSLITGESVPESLEVDANVAAGALAIGGSILVLATATSGRSRVAQIADLVREATAQKAKISNLADRVSAFFVPTVILVSALTFTIWWLAGDWGVGLRAAIAVLVVACPCALGIAVPMSLAVATSVGAKRSVVIRHPDALSLLKDVRTVIMDKTGTVTTGRLRVAEKLQIGSADVARSVALAAALERGSVHPVATAIAALDGSLTAEQVSELAGSGVSGIVDGLNVEVARRDTSTYANAADLAEALESAGPFTQAVVSVDNVALLVFGLEDDIRENAAAAVSELRAMKIETTLLSGDVTVRVEKVAAQLGITDFVAGVSPEEKLKVIGGRRASNRGGVAMVGDGLNDVAALAAADVGIAMGSGTHATQSAAAITILDDDPEAIPFAIALGRRTYRNIRQNLGWAFGYNIVLIPVAALGFLNPMLSGSAMAFSSISVVLNALRLRKLG